MSAREQRRQAAHVKTNNEGTVASGVGRKARVQRQNAAEWFELLICGRKRVLLSGALFELGSNVHLY